MSSAVKKGCSISIPMCDLIECEESIDILSILYPFFLDGIPLLVWTRAMRNWKISFENEEPRLWKCLRRIAEINEAIQEMESEMNEFAMEPKAIYDATCGTSISTSRIQWTNMMERNLSGFVVSFPRVQIRKLVEVLRSAINECS
jgi:hypothetical protein